MIRYSNEMPYVYAISSAINSTWKTLPSTLYLGRHYIQTRNAINGINKHFALCTDVHVSVKVVLLITCTLGYQFSELCFIIRVLNYIGKVTFMLQWNWKAEEKNKIYTGSTTKNILYSQIKLILLQYIKQFSSGLYQRV